MLLPGIAKLFNLVLETSCFPHMWNTTFQVPLYKSGDPLDCNNYRGISITSCLGKLFNSILCQRVNSFLDENDKMSKLQAVFRKNHSTSDHIFVLRSLINKYVKQYKSQIFACFVDFRKAFDTVWRNGMFLKLKRLGVCGKFFDLVKNMYAQTSSSIKLPNGITTNFKTDVGIKQGDSLSPTLFNVYIDDVSDIFHNCDGLVLGQVNLNCLMYADDLLLVSSSSNGLQLALNKLNSYCKLWKLEMNVNKTNVVIFRQRKRTETVNFYLGGQQLKTVDQVKYLGLVWMYTGNFDITVKELKLKGMRAFFKNCIMP